MCEYRPLMLRCARGGGFYEGEKPRLIRGRTVHGLSHSACKVGSGSQRTVEVSFLLQEQAACPRPPSLDTAAFSDLGESQCSPKLSHSPSSSVVPLRYRARRAIASSGQQRGARVVSRRGHPRFPGCTLLRSTQRPFMLYWGPGPPFLQVTHGLLPLAIGSYPG